MQDAKNAYQWRSVRQTEQTAQTQTDADTLSDFIYTDGVPMTMVAFDSVSKLYSRARKMTPFCALEHIPGMPLNVQIVYHILYLYVTTTFHHLFLGMCNSLRRKRQKR